MIDMESSKHLFQEPMYRAEDGTWHGRFVDALQHSSAHLTWDLAAVVSILSHHFPWGDRTLIDQVKRRPWLSGFQSDGKIELEKIPGHDRQFKSQNRIAHDLLELMTLEIVQVCKGRPIVYLLLSGGLDSRIMAAVVSRAVKAGEINSEIIAITWGMSGCRDVVYAQAIADMLGFPWIHVDLSPEDFMENIELSVTDLGCLVPGIHLHNMKWFKNAAKESLVLAASYGDGIGRAEFYGKHLLESQHFQPIDRFGLIKPDIFNYAKESLKSDLKTLRQRSPGAPTYALVEHEKQGFYMRSMIGHVMSIINNYCQIYQVFTHPEVYSYMWSIHPALRKDKVYARMLEKLHPGLARLPWARTNRALRGRTRGARKDLAPRFHQYQEWISGPLYPELFHQLDFHWLVQTNIFAVDNVKHLCQIVEQGTADFNAYNNFTWLVGFCCFSQWLREQGKAVSSAGIEINTSEAVPVFSRPRKELNAFKRWYRRQSRLVRLVKFLRKIKRSLLFLRALVLFPPKQKFLQGGPGGPAARGAY